jgi:hypothetical protein
MIQNKFHTYLCFSLKAGLIIIFLLTSTFGFSQDEEKPVEQKTLPITFRFDGGLGNLVQPRAMRNNFYSVGDMNGGFHFGFAKGWNVGLNMRYTGFQIRQGASNVIDTVIAGIINQVRTIHNAYTPGVTIGYDKWVGQYSFFNFNVNAGYSIVRYSKIRNAFKGDVSASNYEALLIEPGINFMYFFEDRVGMTIKLSYSWTNGWFRPEQVGLDKGALPYTSEELKGNIQFISFGLGFIYSFKRVI